MRLQVTSEAIAVRRAKGFLAPLRYLFSCVNARARTEVFVRAEDVPRGISASDQEAGIASSLISLAAYVEVPAGVESICLRAESELACRLARR